MYHASDAHIITTDDMAGVKSLKLHQRKGRTYLLAEVELNPEKEYTEDGLRLHLTNGVTHRYLMPAEDAPEEDAPEEDAARGDAPKAEGAEKKHGAAPELAKAKDAAETVLGPMYPAHKHSDTKKG